MSQEDLDTGKLSENDITPLRLVNRNPRNLEQMLYEVKPLGFELEDENISYWNRYVMFISTAYSFRLFIPSEMKDALITDVYSSPLSMCSGWSFIA